MAAVAFSMITASQVSDGASGDVLLGGRDFAVRLTVKTKARAAGERDLIGSSVTIAGKHTPALGGQQHAARDEVEMDAELERLVRLPTFGGERLGEELGERGDGCSNARLLLAAVVG